MFEATNHDNDNPQDIAVYGGSYGDTHTHIYIYKYIYIILYIMGCNWTLIDNWVLFLAIKA